jgi:hypothetical protein
MNPNNIKKNDYILVTRDNGDVIFGKATKVAPWTKNPQITVINYEFEENGIGYKSRADARKCVNAPADKIPKAPSAAPIDPIMSGWELGNTQRGPMMMEGYYFSVMVLRNGKRVGKIVDAGMGGSVMTEQFKDHNVEHDFNETCKTWAINNGADPHYLEAASEFWTWWDEARPKGKDAKTYFKEKNEEMAEWLASVKPTHTGDLALVNGQI